ncbi:unnamed protein product [Adineta ricciae]|uniref:Uncharacterized protein n=1 Tax=Adineta ricciae TaxID=249248 RepID=A0A815MID6_ADIRI|nr:unnamed protein product [Adineta ricciae]
MRIVSIFFSVYGAEKHIPSLSLNMGIRVTTEKLSNESKTELKYKSGKKVLEIKLMSTVESTSRVNGINDQFHLINKSVIQFKSNTNDGLTLL